MKNLINILSILFLLLPSLAHFPLLSFTSIPIIIGVLALVIPNYKNIRNWVHLVWTLSYGFFNFVLFGYLLGSTLILGKSISETLDYFGSRVEAFIVICFPVLIFIANVGINR